MQNRQTDNASYGAVDSDTLQSLPSRQARSPAHCCLQVHVGTVSGDILEGPGDDRVKTLAESKLRVLQTGTPNLQIGTPLIKETSPVSDFRMRPIMKR